MTYPQANSRRHKYGAKPVTIDGIRFASTKEGNRYAELILLNRGGHIRQLELQPEFEHLVDGKLMFTYRADFAYFEGEKRVVEDVKGFKTPVYRLKKKIIEHAYHIEIREI
jgi:Protein of unknown function (DUF1064)